MPRARSVLAAAIAGAATLALAGPAAAHISPEPAEVAAGSYGAVTLTVPHGCEESPTSSLAVQIPEGLTSISPMVHPGWSIDVEEEALAEPIDDGHGGQITERVATVTFTAEEGNELPPELRDAFTIGFKAPDTPGEWLFFKTVQTCLEGETAWVTEYTGEGEEPDAPAPAVQVVEGSGDGHGHGGDEAESTSSEDAATTESGSTSDSGDGASTGLAVAGLVAGLGGLALGGTALARTKHT